MGTFTMKYGILCLKISENIWLDCRNAHSYHAFCRCETPHEDWRLWPLCHCHLPCWITICLFQPRKIPPWNRFVNAFSSFLRMILLPNLWRAKFSGLLTWYRSYGSGSKNQRMPIWNALFHPNPNSNWQTNWTYPSSSPLQSARNGAPRTGVELHSRKPISVRSFTVFKLC